MKIHELIIQRVDFSSEIMLTRGANVKKVLFFSSLFADRSKRIIAILANVI